MPDEAPDLTDLDLADLERERDEQVRLLAQLATRRRVLRRIAAAASPPAPKSEEAIARDLGLSRRQVRQLLSRALVKLRKQLTNPESTKPQP